MINSVWNVNSKNFANKNALLQSNIVWKLEAWLTKLATGWWFVIQSYELFTWQRVQQNAHSTKYQNDNCISRSACCTTCASEFSSNYLHKGDEFQSINNLFIWNRFHVTACILYPEICKQCWELKKGQRKKTNSRIKCIKLVETHRPYWGNNKTGRSRIFTFSKPDTIISL